MNCLLGAPEPHTFTGVPSSMRETRENRLYYLVIVCVCMLFAAVSRWISVSEWITLGFVCLVNERWQHMAIFYVEVVIGTKDIGGDDCCVTMTILLKVCPVNTQTHTESWSDMRMHVTRMNSFSHFQPPTSNHEQTQHFTFGIHQLNWSENSNSKKCAPACYK